MEWTKEQREQADKVEVFWEDPAFPLPFIKGGFELHMNTYVRADDYFEARAQLTDALSENERLRSQLKSDDTQMGELAVGGGWISVKDKLPTPGYGVLVSEGKMVTYGWLRSYIGKRGKPWQLIHNVSDSVTHWQPLPAPPSGEQAARNVGEVGPYNAGCAARGHVWGNYNVSLREVCIVCGQPKLASVEVQDIPKGEV